MDTLKSFSQQELRQQDSKLVLVKIQLQQNLRQLKRLDLIKRDFSRPSPMDWIMSISPSLWVFLLVLTTASTQSCASLTLETLSSKRLVAMAIGAPTTDDAQVIVDNFEILCEREVRGCVGQAPLLLVEYQCQGVWCGEGERWRGVELFQACCSPSSLYTLNLATNNTSITDGSCLGM